MLNINALFASPSIHCYVTLIATLLGISITMETRTYLKQKKNPPSITTTFLYSTEKLLLSILNLLTSNTHVSKRIMYLKQTKFFNRFKYLFYLLKCCGSLFHFQNHRTEYYSNIPTSRFWKWNTCTEMNIWETLYDAIITASADYLLTTVFRDRA